MRILIAGSGLMGPAAAVDTMRDPAVTDVVVVDVDPGKLDLCAAQLAGKLGAQKVRHLALDLADQAAATDALAGCDAAVSALPFAASRLAIDAAVRAGVPLVDMSRVPDADFAALRDRCRGSRAPIVTGCGLEPGLTEIWTRHLACRLDAVEEVHIKCGGVPARPSPPLGYQIVFGGRALPLHEIDGLRVEDGCLAPVPRYSGVEAVTFAGVGELEAWHEGFMPWLLELPELRGLRVGTQKTIRWPGYAARITVLKELGLLGTAPVDVDGASVIPKRVVDAVLYPRVKMSYEDRDVTLFRVEVAGRRNGRRRALRTEMVDRFDETTGLTSMARTTGFTAAIVGRMLGRMALAGTFPGGGLMTPENIVSGALFEELVSGLAAHGIHFDEVEG